MNRQKGIDHLFNPRSIAVIGASETKGKLGNDVLRNLIESGFNSRIYPVNPRGGEILGLKAYRSVSEIPNHVDMGIIVIPAVHVIPVVEECGKKGVKALVIITAGFKEIGHEGQEAEKKLVELAEKYEMVIQGPNCLGIINTNVPYNASFSAGTPRKGKIAFASQSGALMTGILDWSLMEKIGFSKFVSLGNKAHLNESDFIEAFGRDPDSTFILLYIESVVDGRKFMEACRKVIPKKPIFVVKSGVSMAGARAATSHTGSLAGSDTAYSVAFKQCGVRRASNMAALFDVASVFDDMHLPSGNRVAIVTNAGGPGILTTDACEVSGLEIAQLSSETIDFLKKNLPPAASVYNPIDALGTAQPEDYALCIDASLQDENVDSVLVLLTPQAMTKETETAQVIVESHKKYPHKPLIAVFMGGNSMVYPRIVLTEGGIPIFDFPERAVHAIAELYHYTVIRDSLKEESIPTFKIDKKKAAEIIENVRKDNRRVLLGNEAHAIAEVYGIPVAKIKLATSSKEAKLLAAELGYPVVLKIASPDIVHKSDIGGIRIGLETPEEVEEAFLQILDNVKAHVPNVLIYGVDVQEMAKKGKELIIGCSRDVQFGPLVMFGAGGVFVNYLKDISFRLAPMTHRDASELILETKIGTLLKGVRGEAPSDLLAIEDTILKISQLVTDFEEIVELDINPAFAYEKGNGVTAVDVKITIGG
ncbi:MAG: acyl-CoA synthetase [Candidatus Thorarchaeota archaeon SMTZ-45]|nr:MAG: acyl-CoA synthetase [Candidatus Thorarchaeota archaeon SMTZ-45]